MTERNVTNSGSVTRCLRYLTALVIVVAGAAFASPQSAEAAGTSVRYSYEQIDVAGESQWALVPRASDELTGKVSTQTLEKAFELLKDDKSTSYGDTSISIDGRSVENARVTVYIDAEHSQYKLIIMAETVYTLTELGVDGVRFPNFADGVVDRSDIPFTAYTVTLPLWRGLPPHNLQDARVRLPNGKVLELDKVERRWSRGDSKLRDALFAYLDAGQAYTVKSVLDRLPDLDVSYVDEVVPLLEHDDESVRTKALSTLENERNRENVLEAVVEMMNNDDSDELAEKAAAFLGKADDESFRVQEQFFYLHRGSVDERRKAAKNLADFDDDERVVDQLAKALRTDADKFRKVAVRAAKSLLELDAHDTLADALEKDAVPSKVRMKIARGLTEESNNSAKIDGYRYLARNATGREARVAVKSLYEDVGTTAARKVVETLLTDDTRGVRLAAAKTVEKFDTVESIGAIADAVREGKSTSALEDAGFEIVKDQGVREILEFTRSSDAIVQRLAYRALGPKAKAGIATEPVTKRLKKGADHSDPKIRGAAARGLGLLANEKALKALEKLVDDKSAVVRRDVAHALGNFEEGELKDELSSYLDDESPKVVAAALSSMIDRREADKWKKIKKLANSDAPIVRRRAVEALATLVSKDDDKAVKNVVSLMSGIITSANNKRVVRSSIRQLGKFSRERAVSSIALKLNAKSKKTRLVAIRALGETGHESAVKLLTEKLGAPGAEVRRASVMALRNLGKSQAKSALRKRLESEKDAEIKGLIRKTIQTL